jgi:MFS family permease
VEQRRGLGAAFANIFTANLASSLGDGIARTAAPLLAIRLTTDPLLVSGIAVLSMLPWLLFAIPAGILVDRIDRRRALAIANGVRTVLALVLFLLFLTGTLTIWWLFAVVFLYGIGETIYDGAIRAVVPSVVRKSQLPTANGRIEAGEQVVQNFAAAPLTSALFALSALIPLGINGAAYLLAVVLAFLLPAVASGRDPEHVRAAAPRESWREQLVSGFRFITSHRMLVVLWLFSTFIGLCFSIATSTFALYVIDRLGLPEALFGVFVLTGAIGSVLGGLLAGRLKNLWGAGLTMAIADTVANASLILAGAVPTLWVVGVVYFVSGGMVTVWNVLVMSLRQSIIPRRLLGRVHGTWRTLLWGAMPLGSLIGGLLGRVDLTLPFLVGGIASTAVSIVFFRFLMRLPDPETIDNGDPPTDDLAGGDAAVPLREE